MINWREKKGNSRETLHLQFCGGSLAASNSVTVRQAKLQGRTIMPLRELSVCRFSLRPQTADFAD